jgi:hypothetical protein
MAVCNSGSGCYVQKMGKREMATVLTFIAWSINLLLNVLIAVTAGCFFLISPTFRRQSYERWTRQQPKHVL